MGIGTLHSLLLFILVFEGSSNDVFKYWFLVLPTMPVRFILVMIPDPFGQAIAFLSPIALWALVLSYIGYTKDRKERTTDKTSHNQAL